MKQKKYDITYLLNKETFTICYPKKLLSIIVEKLINDGVDVIAIIRHVETENDIEKQKYYNSKYSYFSKKCKNNKIDKKTFDAIIQKLKQLKIECQTKDEFEMEFEEYKKTNNILTYTVSE